MCSFKIAFFLRVQDCPQFQQHCLSIVALLEKRDNPGTGLQPK